MSYLNLIGHDLQDVYLKLNKSFSLIQVLQQYDFISFGSAYLWYVESFNSDLNSCEVNYFLFSDLFLK